MIKMVYKDEYQYTYVDDENASLGSQIDQGQPTGPGLVAGTWYDPSVNRKTIICLATKTGSEKWPNVSKQLDIVTRVDSGLAETVNDMFFNGLDEEHYSRLVKDNAWPKNCDGLAEINMNRFICSSTLILLQFCVKSVIHRFLYLKMLCLYLKVILVNIIRFEILRWNRYIA